MIYIYFHLIQFVGNEKLKVLPFSFSLLTQIFPPFLVTMS